MIKTKKGTFKYNSVDCVVSYRVSTINTYDYNPQEKTDYKRVLSIVEQELFEEIFIPMNLSIEEHNNAIEEIISGKSMC